MLDLAEDEDLGPSVESSNLELVNVKDSQGRVAALIACFA